VHHLAILGCAPIWLFPHEGTGVEAQHGTPVWEIEQGDSGLFGRICDNEVVTGESHVLVAGG
jgi:hypothetical protein